MGSFLGFGIVFIIIGLLIIVYPKGLAHLSTYMNKKIFDDESVLGHRLLFGILCMMVGLFFLLMYFKVF